ncbi:DUF2922 domain-containing protein [Enterococcus sp. AZ109]|uniref:DUF2922 domain-containing protein n=1 Tax=Enterococcus sp. AZ109 TaxID=2774634 RepID=UPI003F2608F5
MLKLKAVFEDATGKTHRWSFNEPDPNKSPEKIKEALETMTTLNLFEKNGVRQFQKVVSAKFVETIETPIFDVREQGEVYVADPDNAFAPLIIADEVDQVFEDVEEMKPSEEAEEEKSVAVDDKNALETIETASTPKTVLEKYGIPSQAKAALDAAFVNPEKTITTGVPVVKIDSLDNAGEEKKKDDGPDSPAEQSEVDQAEPQTAERPKASESRKERLDRLRAYHEANKKKQKKKKGKKKKR